LLNQLHFKINNKKKKNYIEALGGEASPENKTKFQIHFELGIGTRVLFSM
jgi:hypothetical protein